MQIKILDKVFECENQVAAVEGVFEQINQLLAESSEHVSCFEIDGVEVYQDYDQYIVANLEDIKTIVIKMKPLKDLLGDAFISIQDYLVRAVPEIENLVNEFYQGVSQNTWNKFDQLLEGLQFIMDALNVVSIHPELCSNATQFCQIKDNIVNQISVLQEAMENQDRVSIGDILLYEIIPSFKMLNQEINMNVENGKVN